MSRIYNSVVGLLCGMGILSSCEIIEYHPYDTRIEGEVGLTEKNIRLIEDKMRGRREFRFAMISDTQRRYDETKEVVNIINNRGDIDFVLHDRPQQWVLESIRQGDVDFGIVFDPS